MHTVIQSAVDSVEHLLPEGLVVDQELLAERPLIIGDPEQLRRAIGIVLENAIEATSAPGALMLRTSWVEKKDGEPKTLRVQISDTGCGIPPEICDRLFEPYATAKKISREKGMGMAILYGIVKNHGGWVEVKTRPKKGTVVSLYLPAGDSSE